MAGRKRGAKGRLLAEVVRWVANHFGAFTWRIKMLKVCPSWLSHWRKPEPDPDTRRLLLLYAIKNCINLEELLCHLRLYLVGSPMEIKERLEEELRKLPEEVV